VNYKKKQKGIFFMKQRVHITLTEFTM